MTPSPIQNLERIDIVGVRKDSGIDLVIVCARPLDGSDETLGRLCVKFEGYLSTANSDQLWINYPHAKRGPVRIFISCKHEVSDAVHELISSLAARALQIGVGVQVVADMS